MRAATLFRSTSSRIVYLFLSTHGVLAHFSASNPIFVHTATIQPWMFATPTFRPIGTGIAGQFNPKFELFFKQQLRLSTLVSVLTVVSITLLCLFLALLTMVLCSRRRRRRQARLQESDARDETYDSKRWDIVDYPAKDERVLDGDRSLQKKRRLLVRRRSDETWKTRLRRLLHGDATTFTLPLSTERRRNFGALGSPRSDRGTAASESDMESAFSTHETVCTKSEARNSVPGTMSSKRKSIVSVMEEGEERVVASAGPESDGTPRQRIGMRILSLHEDGMSLRPSSSSASSRISPSGTATSPSNRSARLTQFSDVGPSIQSLFRKSVVSTTTVASKSVHSRAAATKSGTMAAPAEGAALVLTSGWGPPSNDSHIAGSLLFEQDGLGLKGMALKRPPSLVLKQDAKVTVLTRRSSGVDPSRVTQTTQAGFAEQQGRQTQQPEASPTQASYARRSFTNLSSFFSPTRTRNTRNNEKDDQSMAIVDLESAMSPVRQFGSR